MIPLGVIKDNEKHLLQLKIETGCEFNDRPPSQRFARVHDAAMQMIDRLQKQYPSIVVTHRFGHAFRSTTYLNKRHARKELRRLLLRDETSILVRRLLPPTLLKSLAV